MAKYKSALGKVVDMAALAAKNEKTRAVGNMKVNARGDTIDSTGKIIKPATAKVNEAYSRTVGNRSAQPVKQQEQRPTQPLSTPATAHKTGVNAKIEELELSDIEKDLESSMEDDIEIEKIKAKETGKK